MDINEVALTGEILSSRRSKNGYEMMVEVIRPSGYSDVISVLSEERKNGFVRVFGEARSRQGEGLVPYVHADYIEQSDTMYMNECIVEGHLCKKPFYKRTSTREVTSFMIVIEGSKRNYYIPIVCFGKLARKALGYDTGDRIVIKGRCQTRTYFKEGLKKIAREISAYEIN